MTADLRDSEEEPSYCFLDTWLLSEYCDRRKSSKLVEYLQRKGYTAVVDALSLIEAYNPGWKAAGSTERGELLAELLATIPTVIADPATVVRHELEYYPNRLKSLPVELKLDSISEDLRRESLLW